MVGAIGFEPSLTQPFLSLAGLGWQPKDRNGSQRNNYWTRIGHRATELALVNKEAQKGIADEPEKNEVLD